MLGDAGASPWILLAVLVDYWLGVGCALVAYWSCVWLFCWLRAGCVMLCVLVARWLRVCWLLVVLFVRALVVCGLRVVVCSFMLRCSVRCVV